MRSPGIRSTWIHALVSMAFLLAACGNSHTTGGGDAGAAAKAERACEASADDDRPALQDVDTSLDVTLRDGDVRARLQLGEMYATIGLQSEEWAAVGGVELEQKIADWGGYYIATVPRADDGRYPFAFCYRGEVVEGEVQSRNLSITSPSPGTAVSADTPETVRWRPGLDPDELRWVSIKGGCVYSAHAERIDATSAALPRLRAARTLPCDADLELVAAGEEEVPWGRVGWSEWLQLPVTVE